MKPKSKLIIVSGLPGSGKTTYTRKMADKFSVKVYSLVER